jgi:2-iminobutanoate/2-iminopropanoate deaminase
VKVGSLLFVSGTGPVDPASGAVLRGDIEEQTRLTLENLRAIIEDAGSAMDQVVKTTVFLVNMDDFAAMNQVYAEFFPDSPPARTTIQAARLPLDFGIEIEAVAYLPER